MIWSLGGSASPLSVSETISKNISNLRVVMDVLEVVELLTVVVVELLAEEEEEEEVRW